jgi:hypothetical protein
MGEVRELLLLLAAVILLLGKRVLLLAAVLLLLRKEFFSPNDEFTGKIPLPYCEHTGGCFTFL